jgi:hypothetical protein
MSAPQKTAPCAKKLNLPMPIGHVHASKHITEIGIRDDDFLTNMICFSHANIIFGTISS